MTRSSDDKTDAEIKLAVDEDRVEDAVSLHHRRLIAIAIAALHDQQIYVPGPAAPDDYTFAHQVATWMVEDQRKQGFRPDIKTMGALNLLGLISRFHQNLGDTDEIDTVRLLRFSILSEAIGIVSATMSAELGGVFDAANRLNKRSEDSRTGQAAGVATKVSWHAAAIEDGKRICGKRPGIRSGALATLLIEHHPKWDLEHRTVATQIGKWRKMGTLPVQILKGQQ